MTSHTEGENDTPVVQREFDPVDAARTRIALGIKYLQSGDAKQAKYNLERALSYAPDLPEVHTSLAYYYQSVNENELSEKAYKKAIKLEPDNSDTLNNYGVFLCRIDEYDEAEAQFLKAIKNPTYIRVEESYENLALCALKFDKFAQAEKYFQQALNHNPRRAATLLNMSYLMYAKSNYSKAKSYLARYEKSTRLTESGLMFAIQLANKSGDQARVDSYGQMLVSMFPGSDSSKRYIRKDYHGYADQLQQRYQRVFRKQYSSTSSSTKKTMKVVKKKKPSAVVNKPEPVATVPAPAVTTPAASIPATNQVTTAQPAQSSQSQAATPPVTNNVGSVQAGAGNASSNTASNNESNAKSTNNNSPERYTVQYGDTLWRIANRFKVGVDDILRWNNMTDSSRLLAGKTIIVSAPTETKEQQ